VAKGFTIIMKTCSNFFLSVAITKKQNNQPDVLKNGMPTGLSISLFEMPAQTKEEKYVV